MEKRTQTMKTAIKAVPTAAAPNKKSAYLEAMALAERLHRQFLEMIDTELHRHGIEDINSVQALMVFNIGDDQPSVGELVKRGYYLGTNATYNVHKMVEAGYVIQERSTIDRRAFRVRLSRKGKQLWQVVDAMVTRQSEALMNSAVSTELEAAYTTLQRLEESWARRLTPQA
jgi:DNA-binding MarR family transcriptional regulator